MSPADWFAASAAAFSGASMLAGLVYMRGKLDAHATAAQGSITALTVKLEEIERARNGDAEARGAQGVRNELTADLAAQVRDALASNTKVGAQLEAHVATCNERDRVFERRVEKLGERIEGGLSSLRAELRNVVTGVAPETPALVLDRAARRPRR